MIFINSFSKNISFFFEILDRKRKIYFYFIVFSIFFQSMLEALGIGLVIPVISILVSPEYSKNFLITNFHIYNIHNNELLVQIVLLIILFFFIFKGITLYFISLYYNKFIFNVQSYLKKNFFDQYFEINFSELSSMSSNKLITNISVNINQLTQYFIFPLIYLLSDVLLIFTITCLVTYFYPKSFLIILFSCFLLIYFFFFLFHKYLKDLGKKRLDNEHHQTKTINQTVGSIKISKIFGIEDILKKNFVIFNEKISESYAKISTVQSIPKIAIEIFGFFLISVLIIFLTIIGASAAKIIASLSVFSAAAFKIMPAINRLIFSFQSISFSSSIFDEFRTIYSRIFSNKTYLNNFSEKKSILINSKLKLQDISFKYPDNDKNLLNNANFEIELGKPVGIFGVSGIGKTTLLDLILGLQIPDSGKIIIDGLEINPLTNYWYKNFAYVTQDVFIFEDTLINNITLNKKNIPIDYNFIWKILEFLKLKDFVETQKEKLNMQLGERGLLLSGGQAQRIGIARAIYHQSKIIIMDEPTSSLDSETEDSILSNIHKITSATIIIVSHNKKSFKNCSSVYEFTNDGKIKKI
jgi:ATP-binding cassette subfamily C protein